MVNIQHCHFFYICSTSAPSENRILDWAFKSQGYTLHNTVDATMCVALVGCEIQLSVVQLRFSSFSVSHPLEKAFTPRRLNYSREPKRRRINFLRTIFSALGHKCVLYLAYTILDLSIHFSFLFSQNFSLSLSLSQSSHKTFYLQL